MCVRVYVWFSLKRKIVENDPSHSWCLRWQMADANEVCAVDFMLFYS